ncbi:MAG TPA: 2TM domain-containing protein [Actinomycetota bacterium]|nr:2TM domain-containing protein [Actinomycetota bacterium]
MGAADPTGDEALRGRAIERLKRRRDFVVHLLVYLAVNVFLVVIWASGSRGSFWPVFVIVGWGIAVAVNAWDVFFRSDEDEDKIRHEMDRLRKH